MSFDANEALSSDSNETDGGEVDGVAPIKGGFVC